MTTAQKVTLSVSLPWETAVSGEVSISRAQNGARYDSISMMFDTRGLSTVQRDIGGEIRDVLKTFLNSSLNEITDIPDTAEAFADIMRARPLPPGFQQGITFSPAAGGMHV